MFEQILKKKTKEELLEDKIKQAKSKALYKDYYEEIFHKVEDLLYSTDESTQNKIQAFYLKIKDASILVSSFEDFKNILGIVGFKEGEIKDILDTENKKIENIEKNKQEVVGYRVVAIKQDFDSEGNIIENDAEIKNRTNKTNYLYHPFSEIRNIYK